jgi:hypothetical protein
MALAKDETWGLLIACAIGASAFGLYTYRTLAPPPAAALRSDAIEDSIAEDEQATQAARDTFAQALEVAFVDDGADASVAAKDTTLAIDWFPCSKLMLDRLLRKKNDALTRRVRDAAGLSIERLRLLGFTKVVCDNTRGAKALDDLAPRKRR